MVTNLLSLDQASRTTGYAIFKNGELVKFGQFTLDQPNLDTRLVILRQTILKLIEENHIDHVIYEDIQQQNNIANNVQTFKALAEVYGVISETLEENGISHESVLASSWKSTLGIKGRTRPEQKKNASIYVEATYGKKVPQDTTDAICIGTHYLKKNQTAWAR